MSLTNEGIKAEKLAREWLLDNGYQVQQAEWIAKKDNKYCIIEVKHRELFNPPPFLGTGLDKLQLYLRSLLLKDLDLRTFLMVFRKDTNEIYGQWLDTLEKGECFDTKNNIRIYPIKNFERLQ